MPLVPFPCISGPGRVLSTDITRYPLYFFAMQFCRFARNISLLFLTLALVAYFASTKWSIPSLIVWRTLGIGVTAFAIYVFCLIYQTVAGIISEEDESRARDVSLEHPSKSPTWKGDPLMLAVIILVLLAGIFLYRTTRDRTVTAQPLNDAQIDIPTTIATGTLSYNQLHVGTTTYSHPELGVSMRYPSGYLSTSTPTHWTLMPFASIPSKKLRESVNVLSLDLWLTQMPDLNASLGEMDAVKRNDRLVVLNGKTARAFELYSNATKQSISMTLFSAPDGIIAVSFVEGSKYADDYRQVVESIVIEKSAKSTTVR